MKKKYRVVDIFEDGFITLQKKLNEFSAMGYSVVQIFDKGLGHYRIVFVSEEVL